MKISALRKLALLVVPAMLLTLTGCIIVSIERGHSHEIYEEDWVEPDGQATVD